MRKLLSFILVMTMAMSLSSCQGFIDSIFGVEDNPVSEKPTTPATEEDQSPSAPASELSTEGVFSNEEDLKAVINAIYIIIAQMTSYQQTLEAFRLKKIDAIEFGASIIDENNMMLNMAWSHAYSAIARANFTIRNLKDVDYGYSIDAYLAELIALRSFAYYQLVMLWGDVPLVDEESDVISNIPATKKEDVLTYAYNQLSGVIDKYSTSNDSSHFNKNSVQTLMAEILLALNKKDDAKALLSVIKDQAGDDVFHVHFISSVMELIPTSFASMLNSTSDYCIYNKTYIDFLYRESSGDTNGLDEAWYSSTHLYGMWSAMTRLGVAQKITDCEEYELLMPIPWTELCLNPMITQNPGY